MQNWIDSMQSALDYIEAHLTEDIQPEDVAQKAYVSAFHFQRLFHALCGVTLGEYIRCRRLTLAGQELSRGNSRVIDAALKYGYDSPDSFARAFQKFHGILPLSSEGKGREAQRFLAPAHQSDIGGRNHAGVQDRRKTSLHPDGHRPALQ